MKNILILSSVLLLASCSSSDDCNCTQMRWQRIVEYQGTTDTEFASTGWGSIGNSEEVNSSDCTKDGTIGEKGIVSSEILPNGNTKNVEYEYRITCTE